MTNNSVYFSYPDTLYSSFLTEYSYLSEKLKVRILLSLLLYFQALVVFAKDDCSSIAEEQKDDLIRNSVYPVDEIKCEDGIMTWLISNQRYRQVNSDRMITSKDQKSLISNQLYSLYASIFVGVAAISETDQTSNIKETAASDIGIGGNLKWTHHWNQKFDIFGALGIKKLKYNVDQSRKLTNQEQNLAEFSFGGQYKFSNYIRLSSSLGMSDFVVLQSVNTNEIELVKITAPIASIESNYKIYRSSNSFDLELKLGYDKIFQGSKQDARIKSGNLFKVGLNSVLEQNNHLLSLGVNYKNSTIQRNGSIQRGLELGLEMGAQWSY